MNIIRFIKRLSNVLFIPMLVFAVCILIFKNELNTLKYAQIIRYLLIVVGVIVIVGALLNDKKEKNEKNN